jgi:hypothetical protein
VPPHAGRARPHAKTDHSEATGRVRLAGGATH